MKGNPMFSVAMEAIYESAQTGRPVRGKVAERRDPAALPEPRLSSVNLLTVTRTSFQNRQAIEELRRVIS
jgi:hypothetical protein